MFDSRKSNYLKRAKSGRRRVVKEMIYSLSPPYPAPHPWPFSGTFHFRVFPTIYIWETFSGRGYKFIAV